MPEEGPRDRLYITRDGDWTGKIAKDFNIPNADTVYDNGANSYFREKRPEKNLLARGDEVWVPVSPLPEFPTRGKNGGPVNISVTLANRERVNVRFMNTEDEALSNLDFELNYSGQDEEVSGTTDSEGKIDEELPPGMEIVTVDLEDRHLTFDMGWMDPADTVTGYANRLKNLGYFNHDIPEKKNMELYDALCRFQDENDLTITGNADTPTIDRLVELHGC